MTFSLISRRYHVSKRRIIPLPIYKVNPEVHPEALFKPKQVSVGLISCIMGITKV